jgi:GTPase SAR1 family protein
MSIHKHLGTNEIPKILCGNKIDLRETLSEVDIVSKEEAEQMAAEHKMDYFEVSAFQESGIEEMMGGITQ